MDVQGRRDTIVRCVGPSGGWIGRLNWEVDGFMDCGRVAFESEGRSGDVDKVFALTDVRSGC